MMKHYKNNYGKAVIVLIIFLITTSSFGNISCGINNPGVIGKAPETEKMQNQDNGNEEGYSETINYSPEEQLYAGEYWHPPVKQRKMSKDFIEPIEGNWRYWPYCPQYVEESPNSGTTDTCRVKYQFNIDDSTVNYFYVRLRYKCLNNYGTGPKLELLNKNELWDRIEALGRVTQWYTGEIYKEKTDAANYIYNVDTLNPAAWADGGRLGDDFVTAWVEVEYQTGNETITDLNQTLTDDNHDGADDGLNLTVEIDVGKDNIPESNIRLTLRLYTPAGVLIDTNITTWTIQGTQEDPVTLHVSAPLGQQNGLYEWTLQIHDESYKLEDYRQGKIMLYPNPQPALDYSPNVLHFETHNQSWTGTQTFEIWNSDIGTLAYSISENIPWIVVAPITGSSTGEHDLIYVNVTNTGNMAGYYYGTIPISSNGGNGSIFVDITIRPPIPTLEYSPSVIHIGTHWQGWIDNRTFEIWNGGQGTLSYTISEDIPWITSVDPNSGTSTGEHNTITLYVGNTSTMNGFYRGNITISSNGGTGKIAVDINITVKYNYPPNPPQEPTPPHGATYVNTSPTLSVFVTDSDGDPMVVSFWNASDNSQINKTFVSNNSYASTPWTNLSYNHNYSWFTIADDGINQTKSDTWNFTTGFNTPPYPPTITGPHWWLTNQDYLLKIRSTDLDNDTISFYIDWGDHTPTDWIGPFNSSQETNETHKWNSPGLYSIIVRAKDEHGLESFETLVVNVTSDVRPEKVFILCSCTDRRPVGDYLFFIADSDIYWMKRQFPPSFHTYPPGTELVVTTNSRYIKEIDTQFILFGFLRFQACIVYIPNETGSNTAYDYALNKPSSMKDPSTGYHDYFRG